MLPPARLFSAQNINSAQQLWYRRRGSILAAVGIVALLLLYLWSRTSGAEANVAALTQRLAAMEARAARLQLDLAHQIQKEVAGSFNMAVLGPFVEKRFPAVVTLPAHKRKRILITGGAGFVGSHLVDVLMQQGHYVTVADNLFTGRHKNVEHWVGHPHFTFTIHDVVEPLLLEVQQIYHLACPASPPHYQFNPIKTIKTSAMGTLNMLGLAKRVKARLLFTSTSEVYGDPEVHPQKESYWGNVNTMGPRSCYDEGKRVAETMCYSYATEENVQVRIARIFNTFGPRMHPQDGRVVSNFIIQALRGDPITVYGDGSQTRSFQYVADLVRGLVMLMNSEEAGMWPVNLGNPDEYSIGQFASKIQALINPDAAIKNLQATQDDPKQRRPDIERAKAVLGWQPAVSVDEGLYHTVSYFRDELGLAPSGKEDASAKEKYGDKRDTAPLWVATQINSALTDAQKGIAADDGLVLPMPDASALAPPGGSAKA